LRILTYHVCIMGLAAINNVCFTVLLVTYTFVPHFPLALAIPTKDPSVIPTPAKPEATPIARPLKPRLLRPILPRERTVVDRLIDALVGDGPDRRYALICQECSSHNGMALQEEFEYLGKFSSCRVIITEFH
uniref:Endoplasmic reticulum junction formation protein lunapark n=1 Tax=Echinostoma caproni TaxID=27848 RepID=A0A183AYM7_9TREM